MLETLVVGVIVIAAAGYAIYRTFKAPSCGCGSGCGCSPGKGAPQGMPTDKKTSCGSGCQCKK